MKFSYEEEKDEDLIRQIREGNEAASDYLLEKYKDMVRARARAMFLAGGDTDDLIQEGMIGLFKAIRDYSPDRGSSFRTFAGLCVERQMLSAVQTSNRKKHSPLNSSVLLDEGTETEMLESGRTGDNPEELIISQENEMAFINEIRESLSPLENRVLALYLDGNSYEAIGKQLGKSSKSVDNALKRVRIKVRARIQM